MPPEVGLEPTAPRTLVGRFNHLQTLQFFQKSYQNAKQFEMVSIWIQTVCKSYQQMTQKELKMITIALFIGLDKQNL